MYIRCLHDLPLLACSPKLHAITDVLQSNWPMGKDGSLSFYRCLLYVTAYASPLFDPSIIGDVSKSVPSRS
jgi:hypothetical protein